MKKVLFVMFIAIIINGNVYSKIIDTICISESGNSKYILNFDTEPKEFVGYDGTIRYQFFGQDVLYKVHIEYKKSNIIGGIAVFESANSGETKGNPFSFTYNVKKRTFVDKNLKAKCIK
tara:strand:+ start:85 stop:441 length:357 start_codon:yes stop_codon:yes gene_type:complete